MLSADDDLGTSAVLQPATSGAAIGLLFMLSPTAEDMCCVSAGPARCDAVNVGCGCAEAYDGKKSNNIFKMIANPNVIDFTPAGFANQGVKIKELELGLFYFDGTGVCTATDTCGAYRTGLTGSDILNYT